MTVCHVRAPLLAILVAILVAGAVRAETGEKPTTIANPLGELTLSEPEATLEVWNRPIVTLRAGFGTRTPAIRAKLALHRIQDLPYGALRGEITRVPVNVGEVHGEMISVDGHLVLSLAEADRDVEAGETFHAYVTHAVENLRVALQARADQGESRVLLRGLARSVPATLLFLALMWCLSRARAWAERRAAAASAEQLRKISGLGIDVRRQLNLMLSLLTRAASWTLGAVATYLWLTFVFNQFPYTEPWGENLGVFLSSTIVRLARGLLAAVPSIVVIALIFLITRGIVGMVNAFFRNVERGWVRIRWFDAETARATRRLVVVTLWLFALAAAYPHIPGSHSDAFRGISVFVGVVVSLGSTGLVNQVMSGFVVIYSRAMRPGDWVRVGDVEGRVKEVGMLSTKLTTIRREEVAIPNAVLISASSTNFSSLTGADGPLVSVALTIGYDVPWRQVHELLKLAASRTPGLRPKPEPRVFQRGLSDFYVEYQLFAHVGRPEERFEVLSDLNGHIQDAFNEHGVQIMSPHYVMQPGAPVVVPKEKWGEPESAREQQGT